MTINRKRPKWLLIVSLLAVFAVAAAACADDADDAAPPATTAAPEAAPETDDERHRLSLRLRRRGLRVLVVRRRLPPVRSP